MLTNEQLDELEEQFKGTSRPLVSHYELRALIDAARRDMQRAAVGDGITDDTEAVQRGARLKSADTLARTWGAGPGTTPLSEPCDVPVSADPAAPLAIADLPDWWDARRARLGKPDRSTCAAELRAALAHVAAEDERQRRRMVDALADLHKQQQAEIAKMMRDPTLY